tara:strand:- start:496 stop:1509 length:1014 start_codon:yes stop_codon:yes gene_type:complete
MPVIELQKLVKAYGSVMALNGLNLQVPHGCLYGLLGPNGAGKTTTLRILCTLLEPDSGRVLIAGIDASQNPRAVRRNIGYVAQEVAIDKILTGRELLELQADLYHLEANLKNKRISQLITNLNMDEWVDRRCGTYSGGMRRKLDLASGLIHRPKVLILDEPTVGLDIESRTAIWQLLRELKDDGTTILLSSHYLEEIEALSDEMAIIDNGCVIAEGSPEVLKRKLGGDRVTLKVREFSNVIESENLKKLVQEIHGVSQVVVNKSQGYSLNLVIDSSDVLPVLRERVEGADFEVFTLTQSKPSLDDVYLQATGRTIMDADIAVASMRDLKMEKKKAMR